MTIQLEDPGWQVMMDPAQETWYNEGVFLSAIQTKEINLEAVVSSIILNDRQQLRNIFFEESAKVEILECNIGRELFDNGRYWCSSFVGKETCSGMPTQYFAFVVVTNCSPESACEPIVLSLWAEEDQRDVQVREQYVREVIGKENAGSPYAREFDDIFVFHALSRLRMRLDQLPRAIRVVR